MYKGHGSNLKGLETTATFIEETDEIEMNSPTLTSAKWWPGGLGVFATHALIAANLIVRGVNHGMHLFVTPIRCTGLYFISNECVR
jgi:acyl-CoA oxidase